MAYLPWILLMLASLAASVLLFVWGSRSGQFAEQSRAAYLPLRDMPAHRPADRDPGKLVPEVYVLVGIMCGAALSMLAALVLVVMKRYGV